MTNFDFLAAISKLESQDEIQPNLEDWEKLHQKVIQRVQLVLDSPKGVALALKLKPIDDFTTVIYQGLITNRWGRITRGHITLYNGKLTRLLRKDPVTADLFED